VLVHLVDISSPCFEDHIQTVEHVLSELGLNSIPRLLVFNKEDKLRPEEAEAICRKYGGLCISSLRPESLPKLFDAIQRELWKEQGPARAFHQGRLTNGAPFDISDKKVEEMRIEDGISP